MTGEQEESRVCGMGGGGGTSTMARVAKWEAAHLSSSDARRGCRVGGLSYGRLDHMSFYRAATNLCLFFAGIADENHQGICLMLTVSLC